MLKFNDSTVGDWQEEWKEGVPSIQDPQLDRLVSDKVPQLGEEYKFWMRASPTLWKDWKIYNDELQGLIPKKHWFSSKLPVIGVSFGLQEVSSQYNDNVTGLLYVI